MILAKAIETKKDLKRLYTRTIFNRAPTTSITNNFEVYFERFDNIPKLNFTRTDWQQFCGHLSWKVISDFIVTPLSWPTNLCKGAQCGPPEIWLSELLSDFFYAFCKSKKHINTWIMWNRKSAIMPCPGGCTKTTYYYQLILFPVVTNMLRP